MHSNSIDVIFGLNTIDSPTLWDFN